MNGHCIERLSLRITALLLLAAPIGCSQWRELWAKPDESKPADSSPVVANKNDNPFHFDKPREERPKEERPSLFAPRGKDPKKMDEPWAIRCMTLRGPERFQYAKAYAESLKKVQGLKPENVRIYDEEQATSIYYGAYEHIYDVAASRDQYKPDPTADMNLIRSLSFSDQDVRPFYMAQMGPLPVIETGKPEWELRGAKGQWSLQVAVFYNTKDMNQRRQAAVEYCKLLREQGEEAYYDHGDINSSVCIGAFPKEAIANVQKEDPLSGVMKVTSKIVDQRMLALQKKYPYNLENGHKANEIVRDPVTKEIKQRTPIPSFPVEIPAAKPRSGLSE